MLKITAKNKAYKNIKFAFLFLIVYAIYFSFGFHHLSQFQTADEHLWIGERVYTYWHSLNPKNWSDTVLSDKPGISTALVSGITLFWEKNPQKDISNILKVESLYKSFRLPFLFFNAFFMLFIFWLIKKITQNFWISFWSFSLMLLSPILLGISQIINPDSLFWLFSTATLLSFIAYLETEEKKFIVLAPIFLGLSLLTKFVSVIFFPFLFITTLIFCLLNIPKWKADKTPINKKIIRISIFYLTTIIGSLAVFSLFMPAVFLDKQLFFDYTIGYSSMKKILPLILILQFFLIFDAVKLKSEISLKIINFIPKKFEDIFRFLPLLLLLTFIAVIINWNTNLLFLNPENIVKYATRSSDFTKDSLFLEKLLYQFYSFVFSLTPLVIIFLLFIWIKQIFKKIDLIFTSIILQLFIVVFYFALIAEKLPSTVRYSIILYPLASILASFGIFEFFSHNKLKNINKIYVSLAIIAISFLSLWQIKPFYFSYINSFLPEKYILSGAWGYGGYEAAQYLNSLPDAKNLVVWSDYGGFSKFFQGTTYRDYILKKDFKPVEYYVISQQGKMMYDYWCNKRKSTCQRKYIPLNNFLETKTPVWEMYIGGRPDNFIKIYKAE
ncbi:MAG: phospholipid carrier-dependent glycosyltransferase [Parcubacteria group bacterium]|jgi:4-amino-4-deoxy-L-arabinose transferase-like glycosyltransferase